MEHKIITKKDGKPYTIRSDRNLFFYPDEWLKFIKQVKKKRQFLFDSLIQTGARINEILYIKPYDYDMERKTLTLRVTKTKAKKGEKTGKRRTFKVSEQYIRATKAYIKKYKVDNDAYMFNLKKYSAYQLFKVKLLEAGLEPKDYGLHNIRKTTGNWLKALDVPADEICLRLGHDYNTYLKHYGSASIFDRNDKVRILRILGDIY